MGNFYQSSDSTHCRDFAHFWVFGLFAGNGFSAVWKNSDASRSRDSGNIPEYREVSRLYSGGFVDNRAAKAVEMCRILCAAVPGTFLEM